MNSLKKGNYVQDSICGTWELYQRFIGTENEDKVGLAEKMGAVPVTRWKGPEANRSRSFQNFCKALLKLCGEPLEK